MAEIRGITTYPARGQISITWTNLQSGDWGSWEGSDSYPDKTVHVYGTFGTSTVQIEGTHASSGNPVVVKDGNGAAISNISTPTLAVIRDNPALIRPMLVGGSGASITVVVTGRRA